MGELLLWDKCGILKEEYQVQTFVSKNYSECLSFLCFELRRFCMLYIDIVEIYMTCSSQASSNSEFLDLISDIKSPPF